ncbi:hypothetical protein DPMN_032650 [Dreissena polymorpha]|uniref:Uncharacterized protein n=1 Tax=Dreissena polymorpha TaxID=45954 RepID=A0A9D4M4K7_DREPO|nr:hypothetical protein DPMN_032650 [Dreissena polymorpha]
MYIVDTETEWQIKIRTVHRNLLLPLKSTLRSDNDGAKETPAPKYIIPARKHISPDTDNAGNDMSVPLSRPKRQIRLPQRYR